MTKEEEILQIAEEEFYKNGYQGTSMVSVAKRAGVTHAMVNYYFRSKEQLFLKILDTHTFSFLEKIRPIMKENADFVQTTVDAANSLFDTFNEDRILPFLLQDVARSAPELLDRYREPVEKFVGEAMEKHSQMLSEQVAAGRVRETTMMEMLENVLLLVISSFQIIPTLEKICHLDESKIDNYLVRRKKEIEQLIRSRYSC